jgi:hypothetical protein
MTGYPHDPFSQRFDALADRGTPRGADAVLDAAMAHAAASLEAARKDTVMSDDLTPIDPADISVVDMEPKRARASRRQRGIAGLGIAALLGVGGYAAFSVQGDGGGADSPQAAVEQLADALDNEDALAAIDVMAPREVRSLKDAVKRASDKAEQLDLVRDKADPFAGFEIDVEGLATEVETLAPGFAKVTITNGVIRGQIDPDGLASRFADVEPGEPAEVDLTELRLSGSDDFATATTIMSSVDTIADAGGESFVGRTPMPAQVIGDQAPPVFVIAIEDDGGWYLSPAYTAFEYAREAFEGDGNDVVNVELGSADASQLGAADPEAAVRDAFAAVEASDWERLTELAPPSELPVWEYRELLFAANEDDAQSNVTVESLDVRVEVDGDRATAFLDGRLQADETTWRLGGDCTQNGFVTFSDGEAPEEYCVSGRADGVVPSLLLFGGGGTEAGPLEVQLVREDGRWFVSPVGTVVDYLDGFVDAFDAKTLAMFTGDYSDIESDGTIEYGVAIDLPGGGETRVYDVEVAAGDQLLAQYVGTMGIRLLDPNGEEFEGTWELSYGPGFEVDEAGTYRLVVNSYDGGTFTLYGDGFASIDPAGDLVFGEETTASASPTVYTLGATAGQEIVGRVDNGELSLLDADGNDLGAYGLGYGEVVTLPESGIYRIVVRPYDRTATFTIWNRADAPEGVEGGFEAPPFEGSEECTTEGTVTTCIAYDIEGNVVEEYSYDESSETTVPFTDAPATTAAP